MTFIRTIHALGGGEWSIELHDEEGNFLKEFVGSNGTHSESDDLHSEADEWENELLSTITVEATQTIF